MISMLLYGQPRHVRSNCHVYCYRSVYLSRIVEICAFKERASEISVEIATDISTHTRGRLRHPITAIGTYTPDTTKPPNEQTLTLPKPLVEFANRPMIEHQIESLAAAGVTDIVLAVNYRPEVMAAALKEVSTARCHLPRLKTVRKTLQCQH